MEHRPCIIVGSGPAGTATALHLYRRDPNRAREALLLDKAVHPRDKVCAGGLIPHTLDCLRELDVPLEAPHAIVDNASVRTPKKTIEYRGRDLCHVVRRSEFDAQLARACVDRGIEIRGGERVLDLVRENGSIRVETERTSYRAAIVVGADGSGSVVRRKLFDREAEHIGRAIMCDVPDSSTSWSGHSERRYDFDFGAVGERLRGYVWAFPCLIGGVPHVNLGVYSLTADGAYLYDLLHREADRVGAKVTRVQAFPIRWYHRRGRLAGAGALLAGDAAGVDPLMGEGISFCFEYARLAADAIVKARVGDDFGDYAAAVRRSSMGRKLRRLEWAAGLFYGPVSSLGFALATRSRRLQELGLRWYNGVDGIDRMSFLQGWRLLRREDLARQRANAAAL